MSEYGSFATQNRHSFAPLSALYWPFALWWEGVAVWSGVTDESNEQREGPKAPHQFDAPFFTGLPALTVVTSRSALEGKKDGWVNGEGARNKRGGMAQ